MVEGWTVPGGAPILGGMREVPGAEHDEWVRRMRALARQDAEEMVPRPGFPVFGLAAPEPRPAALASFGQENGSWTMVELAYGAWDAATGPYVAVRSERPEPAETEPAGTEPASTEPASTEPAGVTSAGAFGRGPEAVLLRAVDGERNRVAMHAGVDDEEPAQPPRYVRQVLPAGPALVCRHGTVWAARLDRSAALRDVTVTITGRGVEPAAVRLEPVPDLRALFEARNEVLGRLAERQRRQPLVLEPAEGVAAFRALADFTLEEHARIRAAARAGRLVRWPANSGAMYGALWQRAVREQQRIAGVDKRAANDVVTSVINHLGHLAEQAPWFATDTRLREAAIGETLRHAVLGESVPSLPAQLAWARYWAQRIPGPGREPADVLADVPARRSATGDWLAAWTAWTATA
jgi:hypothetical protein